MNNCGENVYIIINGTTLKNGNNFWESSEKLIAYHSSQQEAESILANLGYEKYNDIFYFKSEVEENNQTIAKIVNLYQHNKKEDSNGYS